MKKRSMDRTGKLIKLFMDRYLGSILLWQCDGSIELIDRNFLDARNKQLSKIYAFHDGWLGNYTMS